MRLPTWELRVGLAYGFRVADMFPRGVIASTGGPSGSTNDPRLVSVDGLRRCSTRAYMIFWVFGSAGRWASPRISSIDFRSFVLKISWTMRLNVCRLRKVWTLARCTRVWVITWDIRRWGCAVAGEGGARAGPVSVRWWLFGRLWSRLACSLISSGENLASCVSMLRLSSSVRPAVCRGFSATAEWTTLKQSKKRRRSKRLLTIEANEFGRLSKSATIRRQHCLTSLAGSWYRCS